MVENHTPWLKPPWTCWLDAGVKNSASLRLELISAACKSLLFQCGKFCRCNVAALSSL